MGLSIFNLFSISCKSLIGSPLRSTLSAVGVFMGVAAVTATMQVKNIAEAVINKQMTERESPALYLWISYRQEGEIQLFTMDDFEFLNNHLKGITEVVASRFVWWIDSVQFHDRTGYPEFAIAVTSEYEQVSGRRIIQGRFFSSVDFEKYLSVAIIDEILANQLFEDTDPINQKVYIKNRPYTVIGVVESKNIFPEMQKQGIVLIPLSVDMAITGNLKLEELMIGIKNVEDIDKIKADAIALLKQRIPTQEYDDFINIKDIIEKRKTLQSISRALLFVSLITLLIGGVGIANVTIASVIQRTPEIGLKRAIGATRIDIMLQFILEVIIISLISGTVAIATVHGGTVIISKSRDLPYNFNSKTATIAIISSVAVGAISALFPALRASKIDPVKALKGD